MNMRIKNSRQGFTLVELMIVVLIISLMIFILIPAVNGVVRQVKVHQTQQLVNMLDLGCQQYKAAFGSYPPNSIEYYGYSNPGGNLDGWFWKDGFNTSYDGEPLGGTQAPFLLTYCLQGPSGMGWKMSRDGKRSGNNSASVTADFGPWMEAGNQSIQPYVSHTNSFLRYRPAFVDSFGIPICYFAPNIRTVGGWQTRPNLACPFDWFDPTHGYVANEFQTDRYTVEQARGFFSSCPLTYPAANGTSGFVVNSLGITSFASMVGYPPSGFSINSLCQLMFYAAMMNRTYNPTTGMSGTSMTGVCYNPDTFLVWSAGPDQLFGFYYWDDTWGGYVLDLTFNPANFDDITNFR